MTGSVRLAYPIKLFHLHKYTLHVIIKEITPAVPSIVMQSVKTHSPFSKLSYTFPIVSMFVLKISHATCNKNWISKSHQLKSFQTLVIYNIITSSRPDACGVHACLTYRTQKVKF